MSTLAELIDKLITTDTKLYDVQSDLYEIRKMSFEEFKEAYSSDEQMMKLYTTFKKACDLNVTRNQYMFAIDKQLESIIDERIAGKKEGHSFDPHKIY